MNPWNVLVFPCGSEIGLEVHRALRYSTHVHLIGASSVSDHGEFLYRDYEVGLPFLTDTECIRALKELVAKRRIDAIYPTLDPVICKLKRFESDLGCRVIAPATMITEICASKRRTYEVLKKVVQCPRIYPAAPDAEDYPIFVKPDQSYGSRGAQRVDSADSLQTALKDSQEQDLLMMEYLPGDEYTVDCFTDRRGRLLFCGPRRRERVMNGISVRTGDALQDDPQFHAIAHQISDSLSMRGNWFFQMKRNADNELVLLEVACRLGGSSALYRVKGVNFALLSVFDAFDVDVDIIPNHYSVTMDRALDNRYACNVAFETAYVDFDDCLLVHGQVNLDLVKFLYQCVNNGQKLVLLTRHRGDLATALQKHRLSGIFDRVVHIAEGDSKAAHIGKKGSIFIDDSHQERKLVADTLGVPVFSPDMVECLIY